MLGLYKDLQDLAEHLVGQVLQEHRELQEHLVGQVPVAQQAYQATAAQAVPLE